MISATEDTADIFVDFYRTSTHSDPDIAVENISPPPDCTDNTNQSIQLEEMKETLKHLKDSAAVPASIHSSMLKHLHQVHLTNFFNFLWKHHRPYSK